MLEGASIGAYRVLRKLGEGGMGAVYLGEHTLLGRQAAIKVLLPELSSERESIDRFFVEARATTAISDPGIVQVYDFGFSQDTAYIVMELLEGEQLHQRLRRLGALTPVDAVRITRQIAGSLHAAHAAGIVHRDLKPENLFMVRDPQVPDSERVKIVDFGIAKLNRELPDRMRTQTGAMLGTPTYMSPEQCDGAAGVDFRSDIYSLGCVMFHLLTGRPPFDLQGIGAIISAHLRETPPLPSSQRSLPAGLDEIVMRCLAKQPRDRFGSMMELQQACDVVLARLLGRDPAASMGWSAVALPVPVPAAQPSRLGRWIVFGALAGGAGSAAAVLMTRTEQAPAASASAKVQVVKPVATKPAVPVAAPPVIVDAGVRDAVVVDAVIVDAAVAPAVTPEPAAKPAPHAPVPKPKPRSKTEELYDDRN